MFNFLFRFFVFLGIIIHILPILVLYKLIYIDHYDPSTLALKVTEKINQKLPALTPVAKKIISITGIDQPSYLIFSKNSMPSPQSWIGLAQASQNTPVPPIYNEQNTPLNYEGSKKVLESIGKVETQTLIKVNNSNELLNAIQKAQPGHTIELEPGRYRFNTGKIIINKAGERLAPIIIRTKKLGDAQLEFNIVEGFLVSAPFWVFENLSIKGVCEHHSKCEHAFHIIGNAHSTIIRNNEITDFNAHFKINGAGPQTNRHFPDKGLIEGNRLYNTTPRHTSNPVVTIDIVGANNWVVRNNLIADFQKNAGDRISYAAYAKGNAENTIFEKNIVACEMKNTATDTMVQVGLSFGGGGTGKQFCRDSKCQYEHQNGQIKNNIITNCTKDVGIYINKSHNTKIFNNALLNTRGIDVRFSESTAQIFNNIYSGDITSRNGGSFIKEANLQFSAESLFNSNTIHKIFTAPEIGNFKLLNGESILKKGIFSPELQSDICNNPRQSTRPDIGPFEYLNAEPCIFFKN